MGRKVATQVHKAATRLMQGKMLDQPPLWYSAVAQYPPLPLPPRQSVKRTAFDLPKGAASSLEAEENPEKLARKLERVGNTGQAKPSVLPIIYLEDRVRRRFFQDHPFEAFRPRSLVEQREIEREHPIQGKIWSRLRQRGRNPTSEDCIKFAVNLHQHHGLPLSQAYRSACQQYAALRAEHTIASHTAYLEAKSYGAVFTDSSSAIRRGFALEEEALKKWGKSKDQDMNELVARKKWRVVTDKQPEDVGSWTRGEEYVRKGESGQRPTYRIGNVDSWVSTLPSSTASPSNGEREDSAPSS